MAEAAWKILLWLRVLSAQEFVQVALWDLHRAIKYIRWPIRPEVAAMGPDHWEFAVSLKYSHALHELRNALQNLNSAAVSLDAAKILALQGGGDLCDPDVALLSVELLAPQVAVVRAALERLHRPPRALEHACASTEWSCAHLAVAIMLQIRHATVPYAIAISDHEAATSADAMVVHAMQLAQAAWEDVNDAQLMLAPPPPPPPPP